MNLEQFMSLDSSKEKALDDGESKEVPYTSLFDQSLQHFSREQLSYIDEFCFMTCPEDKSMLKVYYAGKLIGFIPS